MTFQNSLEKNLEWEEKIRNQKESGLSIRKWCEQNKIACHVFEYWKKKLSPTSEIDRSTFSEITQSTKSKLKIGCKKIEIEVEDPDPLAIREIFAALRGL